MKYIYELKTSSEDISPGSLFWKKLTMDAQVSEYLVAESDAEGCIYEIIGKTKLRPTGKGSETEDSYRGRILEDIAKDPDKDYQRGIVVRTRDELRQHEKNVVGVAAMIAWARKHEVWPQMTSSCERYHRLCEFYSVCCGTDEITDNSKFTVRPDMSRGRSLPVLSHSARTTYARCPREFYFANELRRRPTAPPAHALAFGTAMHKAIQAYHNPKAGFGNDSLERAFWHVNKMAPGHDRGHAKALVTGYGVRWANEPITMLETEREFLRPIADPETGRTSTQYVSGGFIDGIAEVTK